MAVDDPLDPESLAKLPDEELFNMLISPEYAEHARLLLDIYLQVCFIRKVL